MSKPSFESFGADFLIGSGAAIEALNIHQATLSRRLAPYLHRLVFVPTGHSRYSKSYIETLINTKTKISPDSPLVTFARDFANGPDAAALTAHVEESYDIALEGQVVVGPNERRLIKTSRLVTLLNVAQPTVSAWVDRGLLVPETLSGDFYQRSQGQQAYFREEHLRHFAEWQRPISMIE